MTNANHHHQQHSLHHNHNTGSMTSVPAHARYESMTSVPHDWKPEKEKTKETSFFKRLFFQWDIRELEMELQNLKLGKADLMESAIQKTELGFFELFFRMIPVVSIVLTGIFLAYIASITLAIYNSPLIGALTGFFLLQIFIFQNAKIIYQMIQYKIGEKETGRFIRIVQSVWRSVEIFYAILLSILIFIYQSKINWEDIAKCFNNIHFDTDLYNQIWHFLIPKIDFQNIPKVIESTLAMTALFALMYVIAMLKINKDAKKLQKKNVYDLKKEYKLPADLVREKFKF